MNQSPFAASIIREAIQGVVGGSLTWLFACTIAGVIPTAATAEGLDDASWVWAFAWLGHLVTAGIAIWGLPILCLHAVCLSALIHGTERAWRIVAVTFISQLT